MRGGRRIYQSRGSKAKQFSRSSGGSRFSSSNGPIAMLRKFEDKFTGSMFSSGCRLFPSNESRIDENKQVEEAVDDLEDGIETINKENDDEVSNIVGNSDQIEFDAELKQQRPLAKTLCKKNVRRNLFSTGFQNENIKANIRNKKRELNKEHVRLTPSKLSNLPNAKTERTKQICTWLSSQQVTVESRKKEIGNRKMKTSSFKLKLPDPLQLEDSKPKMIELFSPLNSDSCSEKQQQTSFSSLCHIEQQPAENILGVGSEIFWNNFEEPSWPRSDKDDFWGGRSLTVCSSLQTVATPFSIEKVARWKPRFMWAE